MMNAGRHLPVMCNEIVAAIAPRDGDVIVDGTFGAGGYSRALLNAANCFVWAIDRDPSAVAGAEALAREFPDRFQIIEGCFADMDELLRARGVDAVDGVVLDIGVSSMQIDDPERGFSFQDDGPLDMRMDGGNTATRSAADIVNDLDQDDLADIIYNYGEERKSRAVARAIVSAREQEPLTRTRELASVISKAVGRVPGKKSIHPATRTFQALRIFVNDELGQLRRGLEGAERLLKTGGRLCVVSFHSLEDRIVKMFLKLRTGDVSRGSRYLPDVSEQGPAPSFRLQFKGAKGPSDQEIGVNPRSRSARMRAAVRTQAPAFAAEVLA